MVCRCMCDCSAPIFTVRLSRNKIVNFSNKKCILRGVNYVLNPRGDSMASGLFLLRPFLVVFLIVSSNLLSTKADENEARRG